MLKSLICANKWKHSSFNLISGQEYAQSPITFTCEITPSEAIRDNSKIFYSWLSDFINEIHGDTTETESSCKNSITIFHTLNGLWWCFADLCKIKERLGEKFS